MEPVLRSANQLSEDWMFPVFVLLLLGFAYIRSTYNIGLKNTWRSSFNVLWLRQTMREESNVPKEYIILQINFFILIGLSLYCLAKFFQWNILSLHGFLLFLFFTAIVALIYGIKTLGIFITRFLVDGDFSLSEYLYNLFLLHRLLALFLFLPVVLLCYSPLENSPSILIIIGLFLSVFYLYRLSRGLINALRSDVGAFYIFFYICTLEILPLLLTAKFILIQRIG